MIKPHNACVREKSPSGQAQGWELLLRVTILCANVGPRSRHPQLQSSPYLLAMSHGAHALARRARSHCSSSTILHHRRSSARSVTRKRKTPACRICMLHRHAPRAQCTRLCTVIIHTGPRFASQVFMLCKCDSLGYTFHMGASQLGLLRRAQPSTTCVEKSLFAFCVCSHVPYIWPSCVLISSSVCCRRHVRVWGWGQPSSSSAARTSHAHLVRVALPFLQAQRSNTRHPLGDPFSASLRVVNGRGGGVLLEMPAPRRGKRLPGAEGPPEGK